MPDISSELHKFLEDAADVYARHGSDMGHTLAVALRRRTASDCVPGMSTVPACAYIDQVLTKRGSTRSGLVDLLLPAAHQLPWVARLAARMRPGFDRLYGACEIVGPSGIFTDETCRFGLFLMAPGVDYPGHSHAAEELYFVLSGTADWSQDGKPYESVAPETFRHHAPWETHATRTAAEPLLAIWSWTGDIDLATYRMDVVP